MFAITIHHGRLSIFVYMPNELYKYENVNNNNNGNQTKKKPEKEIWLYTFLYNVMC